MTHVGDRSALRDSNVGGQRGAAELAEVDVGDDVLFDLRLLGDARCRLELGEVALAVAEAQRVAVEAGGLSECEGGGRVKPATQENDGSLGDCRFDGSALPVGLQFLGTAYSD
jgi:hypothetical protein